MGRIFRGIFTNTQVDYTDNSGNEQDIYVLIKEQKSNLPYGLNVEQIPSGTQLLLRFSWVYQSSMSALELAYSPTGQDDWNTQTIGYPDATNHYDWLVDNGDYDFRFIVYLMDGSTETYYISAGYYVDIELADAPTVIRTIDNNEDKFTQIRSKAVELRLHTNSDINVMTFAGGGDNQYKVEIGINSESNIIYTGWLSISDLSQTFQPDPNVLVLTATDGLGFLQGLPLTDFSGNVPEYEHSLLTYIAWCLAKTGLQLDIAIEMNLLEKDATIGDLDDHFYKFVYLNALTFETNINEREDCYSVLQKILGEFCFISQQKNTWYIRSIDEIGNSTSKIAYFDYQGTAIEERTESDTLKYIGSDSSTYDMAFMNDDAVLSLLRPYKFVKHTYNYEYPQELVCNLDFSRGDVITAPDFSQPTSQGVYAPDCWILAAGNNGLTGTWWDSLYQAGAYGHLIKDYEYGYEKDRYIKIQHYNVTGTDYVHYLKGRPFNVMQGDKITISVDVKFDADIASSNPVQVRLEPLTGSKVYDWNYSDDSSVNAWVEKNKLPSALIADNPLSTVWRLQNAKAGEWKTISSEIEVPKSGLVYIRLCTNSNLFVPYYFSNLNVTINSKINGSYQKYNGQYNLSEQDVDNKASREENVYITDAPKLEMKGCLLKKAGLLEKFSGTITWTNYSSFGITGYYNAIILKGMELVITGGTNAGRYIVVNVEYNSTPNLTTVTLDKETTFEVVSGTISQQLYSFTEGFYSVLQYPAGPPDLADYLPYGQIQNQAVWNQFNRVFTTFEGTIDGLETNVIDSYDRPNLPDLLHTFEIKDSHPATDNKRFMLLHYDQDLDSCEWGIYIQEVLDSTIAKSYDGHSFKYIQ